MYSLSSLSLYIYSLVQSCLIFSGRLLKIWPIFIDDEILIDFDDIWTDYYNCFVFDHQQ